MEVACTAVLAVSHRDERVGLPGLSDEHVAICRSAPQSRLGSV